MSIIDRMTIYASATGLPPTGVHHKLAGHLISRLSTPCPLCTETTFPTAKKVDRPSDKSLAEEKVADGSPPGRSTFWQLVEKPVDASTKICAECGGFRRGFTPSAIRRIHQIVGALHPTLRNYGRREETAAAWAARKSATPRMPVHLGLQTVPESVLRTPFDSARPVASITWRRGLRSEFLWSTGDAGHCVLYERIPQLDFADGSPWVELFAWGSRGATDPERSAQRLLQRGWSETNVAYSWLATLKSISSSSPIKAFTPDAGGLISERQMEWLFQAAVRTRHLSHQPFPAGARIPAAIESRNIGPYNFERRPTVPPDTVVGRDIAEAFEMPLSTNNVIDANALALRRSEKAARNDDNQP